MKTQPELGNGGPARWFLSVVWRTAPTASLCRFALDSVKRKA